MNTTLKVVFVGCGGISGAWFKPAKEIPGLEIVGLVDLVEANARKRAAEFDLPDAIISTDLTDALNITQPDIVFDCTIPEAHANTTLTALGRGCHVLGEKPLAASLDAARQMVAAAQKSGKFYAVMQNRRYMEQARRIRQLIASGEIGDLTTINSDFYLGAHFGGFRDRMEHVLLLDMAIHTFDVARFMGSVDPVSVYCKEWNPSGSWYDHDASAVAVFEMTNGVVYTYRGSWCAEGLNTTWESEWRFGGSRGTLQWDGAQGIIAQKVAQPAGFHSELANIEIPAYTLDSRFHGHASCIQEFIECVRSGEPPNTICTDNIKSLAMVFAAIESAQTGQVVTVAL